MASLLEELFHDVGRRAGEIAEELKKCASTVPAEVEAYRAGMEQRATRARLLVERILADQDLFDPLFATTFFRDFKDLARLVQELENLPLLVLRRFNDRDVTATKLVRRICDEVRFPYAPPICSSLSSQYYWTAPQMDLVFVPSLEPDRLLGLADVYHELAHILLYREKNRLLIPALRVVDQHFDRLRKEARYANWPLQSLEELELYRHRWRSAWLLEFGADLIATYLAGLSFGWCNIRTSTNLGGELYRGNESHPADDARATAIELMLRRIGDATTALEIRSRWTELLTLSGEQVPQRYDISYPRELLSDLCDIVYAACQSLGLKVWSVQEQTESTVGLALHRAWTEFRQRPDTFAGYELQVLSTLSATIAST